MHNSVPVSRASKAKEGGGSARAHGPAALGSSFAVVGDAITGSAETQLSSAFGAGCTGLLARRTSTSARPASTSTAAAAAAAITTIVEEEESAAAALGTAVGSRVGACVMRTAVPTVADVVACES